MIYQSFGRYRLITRIATGGMAEIYLARQRGMAGFEKLVVIKKIHPHLTEDPNLVEMFLDEARIAARINHPNVVQIIELGEHKDSYYIAMEYMSGESLAAILRLGQKRELPLPLNITCRIMASACSGLHFAHELQKPNGELVDLVHRDISPQNIMVLFEGGVKLIDFGVAKAALQMSATEAGTVKGKYPYMAPEQCDSKAVVDRRADLWAIGVVLWECATRKRLFKGGNPIETVKMVLSKSIIPPSEINPDVPKRFDTIVMRCLERDATHRYQTAREIQEDLERLVRQLGGTTMRQVERYLKRLMPDHIAERAELIRRAENANEEDFEPGSLTGAIPLTGATPVTDSVNTSGATKGELEAATGVDASRRRMLQIGAAAGGALAVLGLTWMLWPSPPALPDFGSIAIRTIPEEATVTLDGRELDGTTPMEISDVSPGKHTIVIGLSGHQTYETETRVSKGESVSLEVSLTPVVVETGTIGVSGRPTGAVVSIDGRDVERLPATIRDLEPDREYEVTVRAAGYTSHTETVRVIGGEVVTLEVSLKGSGTAAPPPDTARPSAPRFGFITLKTTPWTAVYLGSRFLGNTPLMKAKLPTGSHTLRLVNKAKKIDERLKIKVKPGKTAVISKSL